MGCNRNSCIYAIHAARQFIKKQDGIAFPFLVESGKRKEESDGVGRADGL